MNSRFIAALLLASIFQQSVLAGTAGNKTCATCQGGTTGVSNFVESLDREITKVSSAASCPGGVIPLTDFSQCARDFRCNMFRSIPDSVGGLYSSVGGFVASMISESKSEAKRSCLDARGGSCSGEIWAAIFRDVIGIAALAKDAAAWTIKTVKDWAAHPIRKVQDKSASALHFVRTTDREALKNYAKSGAAWPGKFAADIWQSYVNMLKENYSCARWEGAPHYSACLERNPAIQCMNCSDLTNAACGVIGALVLEGKFLGFLTAKGTGFWKDARLMRAIKKSEKTGMLRKAEAGIDLARRRAFLRAVDVSDVTPGVAREIAGTYKRSLKRLKTSMAKSDPGFAALTVQEQERITMHVINQIKLQNEVKLLKRLKGQKPVSREAALNAEIEKLATSCAAN